MIGIEISPRQVSMPHQPIAGSAASGRHSSPRPRTLPHRRIAARRAAGRLCAAEHRVARGAPEVAAAWLAYRRTVMLPNRRPPLATYKCSDRRGADSLATDDEIRDAESEREPREALPTRPATIPRSEIDETLSLLRAVAIGDILCERERRHIAMSSFDADARTKLDRELAARTAWATWATGTGAATST